MFHFTSVASSSSRRSRHEMELVELGQVRNGWISYTSIASKSNETVFLCYFNLVMLHTSVFAMRKPFVQRCKVSAKKIVKYYYIYFDPANVKKSANFSHLLTMHAHT